MIVWVILLVLILFASVMWVSRATENAANEAVQRIHEYHDTHPADDSDEKVNAERTAFLQEEADRISGTNVLYTVVSMGLFLLSITIMLHNDQDTRRMSRQLSDAEKEAEDARRIAELKQSITSLMDNMPALSFSKDAETGVYLACNQAFAEYAHKENPEGVIGLTDAKIFDAETAKHFVEDDRIALGMNRAHIFFEDVPDAAGNQRQFQTTKYEHIGEQVNKIMAHNEQARKENGIVIACGTAVFDNDADVASVFERADQLMYENKSMLKDETAFR